MRRNLVFLLATLLAVTTALVAHARIQAQTGAQRASPEEQLRTKLDEPFLKKAKWLTDYDQALTEAKRRRKLIFGYFTTAGY